MLTLNVRGPSYLGLTRSISWLLMPWLLTSPGHQQPWYWLYRICRFLSYLRKDFISMWRNDTKCKCMFMFPLKNLARKGLSIFGVVLQLSILKIECWHLCSSDVCTCHQYRKHGQLQIALNCPEGCRIQIQTLQSVDVCVCVTCVGWFECVCGLSMELVIFTWGW